MRRKPVREPAPEHYPRYRDLERRRVLRWLGLGSLALAAGTVGCDRISDALGLGSPPSTVGPIHVRSGGDMPAPQPNPPQPPAAGDDDDSAESAAEPTTDPLAPQGVVAADPALGSTGKDSGVHLAGGMAEPDLLTDGAVE